MDYEKSEPMDRRSQPPPYSASEQEAPPQPVVAPQPPVMPIPQPTIITQPIGTGYYPSGAMVTTVMPIHLGPVMSPKPTPYTCPSCNEQIVTRTENRVTTRTHLFSLVMCFTGMWCCCCLPYFIDSCQNIDHYCPNCSAYIGSNRA